MDIQATDQCGNCGAEFAEHSYVPDSINKYECPRPHVESTYGFFHGGDPRGFSPDHECCTEEEIGNHKKACELWDEAESRGETPTPESCQSGWIRDAEGNAVAHVLRSPYGIGIYSIEIEQFFERREQDEEWDDD